MHLDHGSNFDLAMASIQAGYTSVGKAGDEKVKKNGN